MDTGPSPVLAAGTSTRPRASWGGGSIWPGAAELRVDLRSSMLLTGVLTLTGLPAGLLWWALAPRAQLEVTERGPMVLGRPTAELLVAVDGTFVLVTGALGLLAGVAAWLVRRRRGVATLLSLAVGVLLAAVVAWQLGELLSPDPTPADLAVVGARVTTGITLGSLPALVIGPFVAVLAYVVAALVAASDDLDRPDPSSTAGAPPAGDRPRQAPSAAAGRGTGRWSRFRRPSGSGVERAGR